MAPIGALPYNSLPLLSASAAVLLHSVDFTSPGDVTLPTTGAGVATLFGQTPDALFTWTNNGGTETDVIGGYSLPVAVSGAASTIKAVGLKQSGDNTLRAGKDCVSIWRGYRHLYRASNAAWNQMDTNGDFAVLSVFACGPSPYTTSTVKNLWWNRTGTFRQWVQTDRTGVGPGTLNVSVPGGSHTFSGRADDGGIHYVVSGRRNTSTSPELFAWSDLGSQTEAATTGAANGNIEIGKAANSGCAQTMILTVVWVGTKVNSLLEADFTSWWVHGALPTGLDSYSVGSSASAWLDTGYHTARYSSLGSQDQLATGRNTAFSHASKLGLQVSPAATNLLLESNHLTAGAWSTSNATVASAGAGLAMCDALIHSDYATATAANGQVLQSCTTTASALHSAQVTVYVPAGWGASQSGRLVIDDGSSEIASQVFTATSTPQIVKLEGFSHGGTTTRYILEIDTSSASIAFQNQQLEESKVCTPHIETIDATATRLGTIARVNDVYGTGKADVDNGEIASVWVLDDADGPNVAANRNFCEIGGASSQQDRRLIQLDDLANGGKPRVYFYSNTANARDAVNGATVDPTVEREWRMRWAKAGSLPGSSGVPFDGRVGATGWNDGLGGTLGTDASPETCFYNIGCNRVGGAQPNGLCAKAEIWSPARGVSI